MLSHFLVVAQQVFTLFLLMGVGFALTKKGILTQVGVGQMASILLCVVCPCLMINALAIERTPGLTVTFATFFMAYTVPSLVFILISRLFFRREVTETRNSIWFGLGFGNTGYMGIPLLTSIYGSEGLVFSVISTISFNLLMWTYGVQTMGGKITLKKALINPATIGAAIALPLFLTGLWQPNPGHLYLPSPILTATGFLGNLNTPLAMIIVGAQMAQADLKASFLTPKLYLVSALRQLLCPALAIVMLLPFQLPPVMFCSAVILCATPVAGATGMMSQRYGQDTATASQLVTLSTLLSLITLPVTAVVAQMVIG